MEEKTFKEIQAASLRSARTYRGMTQAELAEASGCGVDSIVKWERGNSVMSFESAVKLANALQCDVSSLAKEKP